MSKKKKKNNNSKTVSTKSISSKSATTKKVSSKTVPVKVVEDIDTSFKEDVKKKDILREINMNIEERIKKIEDNTKNNNPIIKAPNINFTIASTNNFTLINYISPFYSTFFINM